MNAPTKIIRATGRWTIEVPSEFQLIDNTESVQAHGVGRVVFVSSLAATDGRGADVAASDICANAELGLGDAAAVERFTFSQRGLLGGAEIANNDGRWELRGFMCADGTLATCVIDFFRETHRIWAVATWRSLDIVVGEPLEGDTFS